MLLSSWRSEILNCWKQKSELVIYYFWCLVWELTFPSYRQTNKFIYIQWISWQWILSFMPFNKKKEEIIFVCGWGSPIKKKKVLNKGGLLAMSGSYFQIIGFGIQIAIFWNKLKNQRTDQKNHQFFAGSFTKATRVCGGFGNTEKLTILWLWIVFKELKPTVVVQFSKNHPTLVKTNQYHRAFIIHPKPSPKPC